MTTDNWHIEVTSADLDFVRRLAAEPAEGLTVGAPTRVPGAADTLAWLGAQAGPFAAGVLSSLVANWIWLAIRKERPKSRVQLTLRNGQQSVDLALDADTAEGAANIIAAALQDADRSR